MNVKILCIWGICSIVIITILCFILVLAIKHPSYFDVIPGYEYYKRSKYFWPRGLEYGKDNAINHVFPRNAVVIYPLSIFLWFWSGKYIVGLDCPTNGVPFYCTGSYGLVLADVMIWLSTSIVLSRYLALFSCHPRDIQFTVFHMGTDSRSSIWRRWTSATIVSICFFFMSNLYMITNTGYVNEDKIVLSNTYSFAKQVIYFEDIVDCEVTINQETSEIISYIILTEEGKRVNLSTAHRYRDTVGPDFYLLDYIEHQISET